MLRNRKEQEERKLVGVNRVADPSKLKLGSFESLENLVPAKRYKIKKKRGVEALVDSPDAPQIPTNCIPCVDSFPVLPQTITQIDFFDNDSLLTPAGASWGFIGPDDNIIATVRDGSTWIWAHYHDGTVDTNSGAGGTINFQLGRSDEDSFAYATGGSFFYNKITDFSTRSFTAHELTGFSEGKNWVKLGNLILVDNFNGVDCEGLREYELTGNTLTQSVADVSGVAGIVSALDATASFYYVAYFRSSDGHAVISKLDPSDLSIVSTIDMSAAGFGTGLKGIHVIDDDFLYWFALEPLDIDHKLSIGYVENMTDVTLVDDEIDYDPGAIQPALGGTMRGWFRDGFFYLGDDGADGTTNIFKFGPFVC